MLILMLCPTLLNDLPHFPLSLLIGSTFVGSLFEIYRSLYERHKLCQSFGCISGCGLWEWVLLVGMGVVCGKRCGLNPPLRNPAYKSKQKLWIHIIINMQWVSMEGLIGVLKADKIRPDTAAIGVSKINMKYMELIACLPSWTSTQTKLIHSTHVKVHLSISKHMSLQSSNTSYISQKTLQ